MTIACTHPGKIGDCLYSLPTVKFLSNYLVEDIDFYTSSYCKDLKRLIEYQPYIHRLYESPGYVIERMDMGVQPWQMPVYPGYEIVYHLGFRKVPDKAMPIFIAEQVGISEEFVPRMSYSCPDYETINEPYVTINPRNDARYLEAYREFARKCPYPVVSIGAVGEWMDAGINKTGMDFLDVATWISKSFCFIGASANLVIAEGFPIMKIVPTDGHDFDRRHLIFDSLHNFFVNPTANDLLLLVENERKKYV